MKTPALCRSAPGRQRGRKVYSLHVPEVECIGKGKTRVNGRRREFSAPPRTLREIWSGDFYALPQPSSHARLPGGSAIVSMSEHGGSNPMRSCAREASATRTGRSPGRRPAWTTGTAGHAFHLADDTADGGCLARAEIKYQRNWGERHSRVKWVF